MLILQQLVRLLAHLFFSIPCELLHFCCATDHLIMFTPPVISFLRYNAFTL
ncbi:hypothetical protein CKO_03877 [Citrobacter koseri ATCC BAA-895]|uniref:Uncharacterized protein n=1 Tax=Citrobacter koseri (strain ATCC BAA-895 / CDC 4225-83 / SGSC4696) TaxID=290338 RepID=A8AN90_CITK8|nr:hypothetical protein CKO_03877 [Citrobacter koseri ATCC BAA-895]KWZ95759.1 hypothetical protein HMPREF3220_03940 [Citrobacter koseri]KXA03174.1 hypothetical protein HMPREF3207_01964 [Citrobacter koseri]